MIPIYEQGGGRGIGLMLEAFLQRVEEICAEHVKDGRARAFAIILRNAEDRDLKRVLADQGAYAKLDRLSGTALSVFFVHTASDEALARFNHIVGARLGVEDAKLPAVAFFRTAAIDDGSVGFTDVEVVPLDSADIIHGLHELYQRIEQYIAAMDKPAKVVPARGAKAFAAGNFVTLEMFRAALREGIGLLF
ncbi:hypothetical protein [Sphingomonas sp. Leaf198]|uniref:hypothetical protein n=1 Tax=Sphingomonas sp. Leaf198 TaxID=1736299 RepID=UPI0006F31201|nr:hypothetical protein [Sphingomonas sp. Leaf198]KQS49486.1 hypothetical protein ASG20_10830 [Sphingomonas sp. Leaf198]